MPKKDNHPNSILREQLNVIIALLLILIDDRGQKKLLNKRRANTELVKYLANQLGLGNKDLSGILNTTESGISNLKKKKKIK